MRASKTSGHTWIGVAVGRTAIVLCSSVHPWLVQPSSSSLIVRSILKAEDKVRLQIRASWGLFSPKFVT